MTSIVQYDINATDRFGHDVQKATIILAAPENLDSRLLVRALVIVVYSKDLCLWKVMLPHPERAASSLGVVISADTNFEEIELFMSYWIKVTLIYSALGCFIRSIASC